jgi:hypothetical protein
MINLGIGIPFRRMGAGIDAQAQAHYNRVIADGGLIPSGLVGVNNFFKTVKAIYGTSDITTAISVGLDAQVLGYKLGAGAGTTAGQAAQKLYSCSGSSGDVVQTTAASQPLLLVHSGASSDNYWYSPRVSGNYISSPYNSSISLRSNFDIKAEIKTSTNSLQQDIFGNANTSVQKLIFRLNSSNGLRLLLSLDGVTFLIYDSTANISNISDRQWVRATRDSSTGVMKFFTSSDNVTYTQLGADVTGATGNLFNGNSVYEIGTNFVGATANSFQGNIYRVLVSQTINGSAVLDFNPATYNAATSQTQWTSSTGEVWSLNKSAGNTFVGVLVNRTIIQGNNTTTSLNCPSLAANQAYTEYLVSAKNGIGNFISRATLNTRSHSGSFLVLTNGASLITTNTPALTQSVTFLSKGANSSISVNNGTATIGNAGTNNGTDLTIAQGAHNINSLIQSKLDDNSTQRTAMYNYIRSINNNAF